MTSVKLFIDHASQPSRAILVFCRINKIPHEIVETRITKGEVSRLYIQHLTPEFAKINPNRKLPAIMHGDFNLSESHSIMRYLARTFNVPEQWYPRNDLKKAAKIDEYLDYHHTGTRRFSNLVFWTIFAPPAGMSIPKSFNAEQAHKEVERALKLLNNYFLANTPYINSDKPSIADLSAYEELIQLRFTDYDFSKYPKVQEWVKHMESIPEVAQENIVFNKFLNAFKAKNPKAKL